MMLLAKPLQDLDKEARPLSLQSMTKTVTSAVDPDSPTIVIPGEHLDLTLPTIHKRSLPEGVSTLATDFPNLTLPPVTSRIQSQNAVFGNSSKA